MASLIVFPYLLSGEIITTFRPDAYGLTTISDELNYVSGTSIVLNSRAGDLLASLGAKITNQTFNSSSNTLSLDFTKADLIPDDVLVSWVLAVGGGTVATQLSANNPGIQYHHHQHRIVRWLSWPDKRQHVLQLFFIAYRCRLDAEGIDQPVEERDVHICTRLHRQHQQLCLLKI